MLREYESMVIIPAKLGDDGARKENEGIVKLIEELGGELVKTDEWGKRELAYEIQKNKEGYYFINFFKLNPTNLKKFENKYLISENIIRYNILALGK